MTRATWKLPVDRDDAIRRLRGANVPKPVLSVIEGLQRKGHAAVCVGGSVRDCLLGRPQGDWDVASSATPDEVLAGFSRTIPTGVEHGTVTVVVGRGAEKEHVEVTTFRGEVGYSDGRRPDRVEFLQDLVGDLERRDFTINALAWDPIRTEFTDAFGGFEDLRAGRIRAVGDPRRRFDEDGLRSMRAVRFAATLEFDIESATSAAIAGALPVFDQVSRERVRVELVKLLSAPRPSLGLRPMAETGLWPRVLVELDGAERDGAIEAVDAMPNGEPMVRLARLLRGGGAEPVIRALDGLKLSRAERSLVEDLLSPASRHFAEARDAAELRRAASKIGRTRLKALDLFWQPDDARQSFQTAALDGAVLSSRELSIKARDLIGQGIAQPGPQLGVIMQRLLDDCLERPELDDFDALIERAREYVAQSFGS